jgi:two-component system, sensor histidine kinase and response regulator
MMQHADLDRLPFRAAGERMTRMVLLAAGCCVMVVIALQVFYGLRIVRAGFDAQMQEIRLVHLPLISAALRNKESPLVQARLKTIAALPQVAGVRLVLQGGHHIDAGAETVDEAQADVRMEVVSPTDAGDMLGRLYLRSDQRYVFHKLLMETVVPAGLTCLFMALLCFLLLRALRAEISSPLQRLVGHVNATTTDAAPPYSSGRAPRPWRDEFDQLGTSFASLQASLARIVRELRQAEQALTQERDRLERKVAERTRELQIACDQADQANRSKSEFLASMSHEIRTPINAIAGFITLVMRTELSQRQADYLDKINGATRALQGIISDVLDFSKIEAGRLDMEHIPFSVNDVLDTAIDYIGAQAERKGLELLVRVAPEVPSHCIGDPLRLGQILNNLCSNAVKFTDRGEVEIGVSLKGAPGQGDDRVRLLFSVRDTGIGLTPEQSGNLFQAFTQADISTSRKFGGTGLGLVICKRLAGMMRGDIWLESRKEIGTTFFFEVEVTGMPANVQTLSSLPPELAGKRALVVDDNSSARQILAEQLAELGMGPHAVDSGDAAVAELRRAKGNGQAYSVVLMDWRMPGLDGLETAQIIQGDSELKDTTVIIMVAAHSREQMLAAGADVSLSRNILLKPSTTGLLAQSLRCAGTNKGGVQLQLAADKPAVVREQRLPGIRLLLVEDNPVNQQLARELLEMEGATVVIAGNGRIALDKLADRPAGHFHAVLLDLHMPEMDGYETARRIRAMTEHAGMPLIAMTAHAMKEERERCLSLGMNDHLTKPIETELLLSKLVHWIGADEARPARGVSAKTTINALPEAPAMSIPGILPGIDMEAALHRCGGNERLLRSLLAMFQDNFSNTLAEMRRLCDDGRWTEACQLAHSVRGAAANLSMDELASTAGGLELALKASMLAMTAEAEQP